jgi:hypothetical protein
MEDPLDPLDSISSTSSSNNCTICFTEISEDEKITLNCNHYFCNSCIQDWLDKKKYSCPLCRSDIKEYNLNDKNYRIVLKENNPVTNTRSREINDLNRYLIRVNARLKCLIYVSLISTTYLADMYFRILSNYNDLHEEYQDCKTNLTLLENVNMNILSDIGMYSLDRHIFRECSIPKYFYDKCFMSYNYNE